MGFCSGAQTVFGRFCIVVAASTLAVILSAVGTHVAAQNQSDRSSFGAQLTDLVASITGSGTDELKDERTRFIVALSKPTKFQVFALSEPNRVIVDMPSVGMRLPEQPKRPIGVITAFRAGEASEGRTRVVIDVSEPVVVENAEIRNSGPSGGTELVLDILPVRAKAKRDAALAEKQVEFRTAAMGLGGFGLQPPLPRAAESPETISKKTFKRLIVLDPGHGGRDSGARKHGVNEKDVVLAFGLKLRDKLLATGRYRVLMTRDQDEFIPLGVRRAFAEKRNAALFISIHADYASRASARGATIYSLRERVAESLKTRVSKQAGREASQAALSESEVARIQKAAADVGTIRSILAQLAEREIAANSDRTSLFSETVVKHMSGSTGMRSDPHKEAAFKVLRTAKMPAVLIELAYVSNKHDAQLLTSEQWRNRVADSIVDAVDRHFSIPETRLPL